MIGLLIFISLSIKAQIVEDVIISTNNIASKKLYMPVNQRNPMIKPSAKSPTTLKYSYSKSTSSLNLEFNIDNLVLEGIMLNPNFKEALLRDTSSGQMYIVRYGRIYTLNRKQIEGYSVEIAGKSVIINDKKKGKKKELILMEGDGL